MVLGLKNVEVDGVQMRHVSVCVIHLPTKEIDVNKDRHYLVVRSLAILLLGIYGFAMICITYHCIFAFGSNK